MWTNQHLRNDDLINEPGVQFVMISTEPSDFANETVVIPLRDVLEKYQPVRPSLGSISDFSRWLTFATYIPFLAFLFPKCSKRPSLISVLGSFLGGFNFWFMILLATRSFALKAWNDHHFWILISWVFGLILLFVCLAESGRKFRKLLNNYSREESDSFRLAATTSLGSHFQFFTTLLVFVLFPSILIYVADNNSSAFDFIPIRFGIIGAFIFTSAILLILLITSCFVRTMALKFGTMAGCGISLVVVVVKLIGGYFGGWIVFIGFGMIVFEYSVIFYILACITVKLSMPSNVYTTLAGY